MDTANNVVCYKGRPCNSTVGLECSIRSGLNSDTLLKLGSLEEARSKGNCHLAPENWIMSSETTGTSELSRNNECAVEILSSWHCATNNPLQNTLVVQDSREDVDPIQLMSPDTCVFLTKEGKDDAFKTDCCSITLKISGKLVFSTLSILSEARVIEIHGPCDEYLKTIKAEFLLEDADTVVYCADIKLDDPCNYLLIKFNGLKRDNELWLYGISVCWKDSSSILNSLFPKGTQSLPFNLGAVNRRLSDLGLDLSTNAQQFKNILQLCSSESHGDTRSTNTIKPLISTLVSSLIQSNHPRRKETISNEKSDFELVLDVKLKELECHILDEVDKRIQEMEKRQKALINDGFEKIMKQLQLGFNRHGENSSM